MLSKCWFGIKIFCLSCLMVLDVGIVDLISSHPFKAQDYTIKFLRVIVFVSAKVF